MVTKTRTIEVDADTADTLNARAAERGVSVARVVAELVNDDSAPLAVETEEIAELDRRWKKIEADGATVSHDQVVGWLETWGTSAFRPWHER